MTLGANQPYFLPYLGYFQLINAVDRFLILDDFNYINRGWINRNRILRDGKVVYVTIPLRHASQNRLIKEIVTIDSLEKPLRCIEAAYKQAPFFDEVFPLVHDIITFTDHNLNSFLLNSLQIICGYLKINTPLILNSQRNNKTYLRSEKRMIHICKTMGADIYINAIGGIDLYSHDNFDKERIQLKFLKSDLPQYKQMRTQKFVPALSILDIMMNVPRNEICDMLDCYRLI